MNSVISPYAFASEGSQESPRSQVEFNVLNSTWTGHGDTGERMRRSWMETARIDSLSFYVEEFWGSMDTLGKGGLPTANGKCT